jgi:nucleotide-binding universal stress UspA family protein
MVGKIVVGTDGSETAEKAVDFAVDLAARYGAELLVASSYRPVSEHRVKKEQKDAPADIQWSLNPFEDVEAALKSAEDKALEREVKVSSEARRGDPAELLCEIAGEFGADLLIVGSKGMERRLLGSVPNKVSHKAPCSVTIVKTD